MSTEIPRGQRLAMTYAGADWLRSNLEAEARSGRLVRTKRGRKREPVRADLSPLGETVADALGFVVRGLYHIPWPALRRVEWWDERYIEVGFADELATWDFNLLTVLVVVCHDLGLRLAVYSTGPRALRLGFSQRTTREGPIAKRMPTIEEQIETIRAAYRVLPPIEGKEAAE